MPTYFRNFHPILELMEEKFRKLMAEHCDSEFHRELREIINLKEPEPALSLPVAEALAVFGAAYADEHFRIERGKAAGVIEEEAPTPPEVLEEMYKPLTAEEAKDFGEPHPIFRALRVMERG